MMTQFSLHNLEQEFPFLCSLSLLMAQFDAHLLPIASSSPRARALARKINKLRQNTRMNEITNDFNYILQCNLRVRKQLAKVV